MSPIVSDEVERYAEEHTTPEPAYLLAVAEETRRTTESPQMMVGRVEGALLAVLVHLVRARRVLEIGTFTGYSSLCMAAALPKDGRIVSCDVSEEHLAIARRHIEASPHANRIELRLGPALETISTLSGPFELVFIDADKNNYVNYYEAILPLLAERGVIAVDNVLWGGGVLDPDDQSEQTRALRDFNDHVRDDSRVECVMLTLRDGVTLIRKRRGS